MTIRIVLFAVIVSGVIGCSSAARSSGPASHHAQRKYDDAVRKGTLVPLERSDEGKERK